MNNASRRVSYANDEEMQQHSLLTAANAATTTFLPRELSVRNSKRNKLETMVNQSSRNAHERAKKSSVEIPQPLPTTPVFSSSEISAIFRAMHQNFLFGKPINSGSLLQGQKG